MIYICQKIGKKCIDISCFGMFPHRKLKTGKQTIPTEFKSMSDVHT